MAARREVLLILPESFYLARLPSCKQSTSGSPLESTLLGLLASVHSKELTETLSPLEATHTKYIGGRVRVQCGYLGLCVPRLFPRAFQLSPLFSNCCALFGTTAAMQLFWNQFVAHSFRRHGGVLPSSPICYSLLPRPLYGSFLTSLPAFSRPVKLRGRDHQGANHVGSR